MPAIIKRKPLLAEWADESDSVMDGGMERALRKIIGAVKPMLPEGDPFDAVNPMPGGALASPLITIFKNSVARKKATEVFKAAAATRFGGNAAQAAEHFANKYPRVAAHIDPKALGPAISRGQRATAFVPEGTVKEPVKVGITDEGLAASHDSMREALLTMYEEGAHVAQALGDSNMSRKYVLANKLAGYDANPFEVSAKGSAERAVGKQVMHRPAARGLNRLANSQPASEAEEAALNNISTKVAQDPIYRKQLENRAPDAMYPAEVMIALRRMLELRNVK